LGNLEFFCRVSPGLVTSSIHEEASLNFSVDSQFIPQVAVWWLGYQHCCLAKKNQINTFYQLIDNPLQLA
jgi:hypothetical protein